MAGKAKTAVKASEGLLRFATALRVTVVCFPALLQPDRYRNLSLVDQIGENPMTDLEYERLASSQEAACPPFEPDLHDCSIYIDHWVSRKKRVHTLYVHSTNQWAYHTYLEDALNDAIERGCTTILFSGRDLGYLFQLVKHGPLKE